MKNELFYNFTAIISVRWKLNIKRLSLHSLAWCTDMKHMSRTQAMFSFSLHPVNSKQSISSFLASQQSMQKTTPQSRIHSQWHDEHWHLSQQVTRLSKVTLRSSFKCKYRDTVWKAEKERTHIHVVSVPNRWDSVCSTRARRHVIVSAPLLQRASPHMQGLKGHVNMLEERSFVTTRQLSPALELSWDSSYCRNQLP